MKIAIQGCTHGDLDLTYKHLDVIAKKEKFKIDLLICCGDFQANRNQDDLKSMACPKKYAAMKDFHDYYAGRKQAPMLTIFIGGNHEAANHMWLLPYGGWVAKNIYYMGYAGVLTFKGIRIAGSSGIFNSKAYNKGHFEYPPFNHDTKRSFYYTRHLDIARLKAMFCVPIDICLSHDWPSNIQLFGNVEQIYEQKPYLRKEPLENFLPGNDAAEELLHHLQPNFWFSGHHHCKFSATIKHPGGNKTDFIALGKCGQGANNFLEVIEVSEKCQQGGLFYDPKWLAIIKATDNFVELSCKEKRYGAFQNIELDESFCSTELMENAEKELSEKSSSSGLSYFQVLPLAKECAERALSQTKEFCEKFGLTNPCDCF